MTVSSEADSRRQFLQTLATLCIAAAATPASAADAPPRNAAALEAKAAAQWARLRRGLDTRTIAACRKAAGNLAPRAVALLAAPGWDAQTIRAVVDELKKAGVYPDRGPPLDAACAKEEEANRLRNEAESRKPAGNSTAASLAVAGAVVATLPGVGPVIAAVLALIAAVIILIGQLIAKEQEDRAAAKKKPPEAKEREARKVANANLLKLQDALVLKLEPVRDCHCFGKKA